MPYGSLEPYDVTSNQWPAYIRRVKQYFIINQTENELKVPLLLSAVGDATYSLMSDICSPIHPEDVRFDALIRLMTEYLEKQEKHHTEIAERHVFRQRRQRSDESLVDYLESLQRLAKTCNFGTLLKENLRDQFISGLADKTMRSKLFAEKNIQYPEAVALALALERSKKNMTYSKYITYLILKGAHLHTYVLVIIYLF